MAPIRTSRSSRPRPHPTTRDTAGVSGACRARAEDHGGRRPRRCEEDFRGTYASVDDYVRDQVGEHLEPHMRWLLGCCDPVQLRAGYENGALRIWTIALQDGRVLLFESQAELGRRRLRG